MSELSSKFITKISPLIEGQVPDFVQAEHPIFVDFVRDYFKFLEASKMQLTAAADYIKYETETISYILSEDDGDRILAEKGSGTLGQYEAGETIKGSLSNATAEVLVEDVRNGILYTSSNHDFITGESIIGLTSAATGVLTKVRSNPVQTIQQLLDYANVDNTIYDFLDKFRDSFMEAIPQTLATGVSKQNLIKNIKDLYTSKGTSEGHKLFMRLLLDEEAEIFYPTKNMLRVSDGEWRQKTIMRVESTGVAADEIRNQQITGSTSLATAVVVDTIAFQQESTSVVELEIDNIVGTFLNGEDITAISTKSDVQAKFIVKAIVATGDISKVGALNTDNEVVDLEPLGNNFGDVRVDGVSTGGVDEVEVDTVGVNYQLFDPLVFTSTDANVKSASGFVSMVGGGVQLENSTTDGIQLEEASRITAELFNVQLEEQIVEKFIGNGVLKAFTLTSIAAADNITVFVDDVQQNIVNGSFKFTRSGSTVTLAAAPATGKSIVIFGSEKDSVLLNGTDSDSTDAGFKIVSNNEIDVIDSYGTATDQIVLEEASVPASEVGSIRKIFVESPGNGYTTLPTIAITTKFGTNAVLTSLTDSIGKALSLKVNDGGFNYNVNNFPAATMRAHFILKDVSGAFGIANTLTTHTGTVKAWDANTKLLTTTFENVIRVDHEQDGTFNEGIQLEEPAGDALTSNIILQDTQFFVGGDNIVLDGTEVVSEPVRTFKFKVKVYTPDANADIPVYQFTINEEIAPVISLKETNTFIFDTSDSSLFNTDPAKSFNFGLSTSPDGSTLFTTGVTQSIAAVTPVGTKGSFFQIVVPAGAPTLNYLSPTNTGMGNKAITPSPQTSVLNGGANILTDGFSSNDFQILLETGTIPGGNETGVLVTEETEIFVVDKIVFDTAADEGDLIILESAGSVLGGVLEQEDSNGRRGLGDQQRGTPFALEESILNFVQGVEDKLLLDNYLEIHEGSFRIVQEDGSLLHGEEFGHTLILEDRDGFLLDDETNSDTEIVLNGTDSSSLNAGENIINEVGIDFSGKDITITDSGGATGTIVKENIGVASTSVATTATDVGSYRSVTSLINEDLIRIQDSFFYQDFSYEVSVGQSTATYINELKKAVHPAGFMPFGKVSLASFVSAAIGTTGAGVSGFAGTRTFTPELASVLETIFAEEISRRLKTSTTTLGNRDNQIVYENGYTPESQIILDGSSTTVESGTPVGTQILLEDNLQPENYDYAVSHLVQEDGYNIEMEVGCITDEYDNLITEDGDTIIIERGLLITGAAILWEDGQAFNDLAIGGKLMSEDSHASGKDHEVSLQREIVTKVSLRARPRTQPSLFNYLFHTPFGTENPYAGIQLENTVTIICEDFTVRDGSERNSLLMETGGIIIGENETQRVEFGNIIMNGEPPLPADGFIDLEDGSSVVLEAEIDVPNSFIITEESIFQFLPTQVINVGDRLTLDIDDNDDTFTLLNFANISFNDIANKPKILQEGLGNTGQGISEDDNQGVLLESDGALLLDASSKTIASGVTTVLDAGSFLAQETIANNHFTLEEDGVLVVEDHSTNSRIDFTQLEQGLENNLILEADLSALQDDVIKIEDGTDTTSGDIVLDQTDAAGSDEGDRLIQEQNTADEGSDRINHVLMETSSTFADGGTQPQLHFDLNRDNTANIPVVRPAIIHITDAGDIALEDDSGGFLTNETNGSMIDLENGTLNDILLNAA